MCGETPVVRRPIAVSTSLMPVIRNPLGVRPPVVPLNTNSKTSDGGIWGEFITTDSATLTTCGHRSLRQILHRPARVVNTCTILLMPTPRQGRVRTSPRLGHRWWSIQPAHLRAMGPEHCSGGVLIKLRRGQMHLQRRHRASRNGKSGDASGRRPPRPTSECSRTVDRDRKRWRSSGSWNSSPASGVLPSG